MKKWSGKKHLCDILLVALIVCLCWGCGNAQEEVMSDNVSAGEEVTAEDKAEKDVGQKAVTEDGAEKNVGQKAATEEGMPKGAGSGGVNAVSGNLLSQAGAETQMAEEQVTAPGESEMPRREPVKVKGIYVSGPVAGIARMDDLIELVDQTELNAMVIDIKNDEGKVTYKMQSEQVLAIEAAVGYIPDIEALVKKCKEKDIYLIARIVAFRDPYLAEKEAYGIIWWRLLRRRLRSDLMRYNLTISDFLRMLRRRKWITARRMSVLARLGSLPNLRNICMRN